MTTLIKAADKVWYGIVAVALVAFMAVASVGILAFVFDLGADVFGGLAALFEAGRDFLMRN